MKNIFEISNDSGLIGLINSDLYQSFVDEDWELSELLKRFQDETNLGHSLIWHCGTNEAIIVEFVLKKTMRASFREIYSCLKVTNQKIWLTNYEDLSMAAQFEEDSIPADHNSDLGLDIENGNYQLLIRQLFNPEKSGFSLSRKPTFEIVCTKMEVFKENEFDKVIWWES